MNPFLARMRMQLHASASDHDLPTSAEHAATFQCPSPPFPHSNIMANPATLCSCWICWLSEDSTVVLYGELIADELNV